jgi:uroporphyrinogen-III synthase
MTDLMAGLTADRPLLGRRVLVTRARDQSSKLLQRLEALGAEVVAIPAIEIVPPDSYTALDAALRDLAFYDWLVVTSANALRAIADRLREIGVPVEALSSVYIAAIGNATADAITALGLAVELIPPAAVAESLAAALAPRVTGKQVLLIRAKVARDVLPDTLTAAGAVVTIVDAYQTVIPHNSVDRLRAALLDEARPIDAVTFTSASSVQNLVALAEAAGAVIPAPLKKISIGPITTQALKEHGWHADAEAVSAGIEELVAAVVRALTQ